MASLVDLPAPERQHPRCFPPGGAVPCSNGPRLSCRSMDAQAIKNLGGALQIIGVVIVVWDLLNVHLYLGDLTRLKAWLQTRRVRVEGWLRRLLRRPGRSVVVHAHPASMVMIADSVTARLTPDPFIARPDQSP